MDISVDQKDLLRALNLLNKAVSGKSTIPTLSGIYVEASTGILKLKSTNLDLTVEAEVPAICNAPGTTVLLGKVFLEIIKNCDEPEINITSLEHNLVEVKSTKYKFDLNTMLPQDYPQTASIKDPLILNLSSKELSESLKKVIRSASLDETRIIYTGIYFKVADGFLEVAATDSYRLAVNKIEVDNKEIERSIIIPSKVIAEILNMINDGNDEIITVELTENLVGFRYANYYITSKLIEGNYPNYHQLIPTDFKIIYKTKKIDLVNAIRRMNVLADNHLTIKMSLSEQGNKLSIRVPEIGEAEEEIGGELTGPPIEIGFNPKYISDGLNNIGDSEVTFLLTEPLKPALMSCESQKDLVYLVMPMRIT